MRATVFLHLGIGDESSDPVASVLETSDGRRFISLDASGVCVHLPGRDADCAAYARAMAAVLTRTADELAPAPAATTVVTCPACGTEWGDVGTTPAVIHRTELCINCAPPPAPITGAEA